MRKQPRQLSPVWFYDELGSFLFDNICELPEYYLTRTELQIMRQHAGDMAHHIGPDAALIEFGSGTSTKTRELLNHLEKAAAYVPVDISRDHLLEAASAIARDYSTLRVIPICADFTRPFDLPRHVHAARTARRLLPRLDARQLRSGAARTPCCSACGRSSARTAPC